MVAVDDCVYKRTIVNDRLKTSGRRETKGNGRGFPGSNIMLYDLVVGVELVSSCKSTIKRLV